MYRIMIVEDDNKIAAIVGDTLVKYGYDVVRAMRYDGIKDDFVEFRPDLVLLDIHLPYYDGFYWCRQIRTVSNVPILFVTARSGDMDQVMALENGGDDYLTKPFHLDVMLAKVKSALRRAYGEYAATAPERREGAAERIVTEAHGLTLDPAKHQLEWNGHRAELTRNECLLLDCLMKRVGEVVSRELLLEALWDDVRFVDDNTLTVNVTRVRKKLEEVGIVGAIETVRGSGYRLNVGGSDGSEADL